MKKIFSVLFVCFFALSFTGCDAILSVFGGGDDGDESEVFTGEGESIILPVKDVHFYTSRVFGNSIEAFDVRWASPLGARVEQYFIYIRHQSNISIIHSIPSHRILNSQTFELFSNSERIQTTRLFLLFSELLEEFPGFIAEFDPEYPEAYTGYQIGVRAVFPEGVQGSTATVWSASGPVSSL